MGGSNGGLLVGAVMEQRPDLFAVALPGVAVLDMLRFHRFTGGVVGTAEYGSADNATEFAYLYKVLAAAQRNARRVLSGNAHHNSGS